MNKNSKVIEVIGTPGSGKSTLVASLQVLNSNIHIESFPYYRKISDIPFFVKYLALLLPAIIKFKRLPNGKWFTVRDIVSMLILSGWYQELNKKSGKYHAILLDEGAIGISAWLKGFGSEYISGADMQIWWKQIYAEWAKTLDVIIQLETPTSLLLQRVRTRDHGWDDFTDDEILHMIKGMETAQNEALEILASVPGAPRIVRINTEGKNQIQIRDEVIQKLDPVMVKI